MFKVEISCANGDSVMLEFMRSVLFVDNRQLTRALTPATYRALITINITAELKQYYVSEPKYSLFKRQYRCTNIMNIL